jgi:uncharacterized protein YceK
MRSAFIVIALVFPLSGCAAILGLDSGNDVTDDADAEAGAVAEDAATDGPAKPPVVDSGPKPPMCAPDTADCNGNATDGCETSLSSPQHCGSCTTACTVTQSCSASKCCTNDNLLCATNQDCCSGKCNGHNCGH